MVDNMAQIAEWIPAMPSPSIMPEMPVLDRDHLARMTLGELALEREVLALFAAQVQDLVGRLARTPDDAASIIHQLKGAAASVGACKLADAADLYEADLRAGLEVLLAFEAVSAEAVRARTRIDSLLKRS